MIKNARRFAAFFGTLIFSVLMAELALAKELPDSFSMVEGQSLSFSSDLPVTAVSDDSVTTGASLKAGCRYTSDLKLFGFLELKSVDISVIKPTYLIPGGEVFGIKLYTQGVMVVGMTDVDTAEGLRNPAYEAGIRKGDILVSVDGKTVNTNREAAEIFEASGGKELSVSVQRGGTSFVTSIKPAKSVSASTYKAGLWVRDSEAGIGTFTFYDPETRIFGGLGHGVCDVDTGEILPLMSGQAVKANITDIARGTRGHTGELEGALADIPLGSLLINQPTGIYGLLNSHPVGKAIPAAMNQQVSVGKAQILVTLDATGPHAYDIKIEKVNFDANTPTKNMILRITDPELLKRTGGIVQGMSGCPIIQNGRLVGAVTHVFVNDPERGYGIFIENMIKTAKTLANK